MLLDLLAEWQACGVNENHIDSNTYNKTTIDPKVKNQRIIFKEA
jgi:hypothetical protein